MVSDTHPNVANMLKILDWLLTQATKIPNADFIVPVIFFAIVGSVFFAAPIIFIIHLTSKVVDIIIKIKSL